MLTVEEYIDNLVRHIELVRGATLLLGKRLMAQGRKEFGRILIGNGFNHDASKFAGIEWEYLHAGSDVPRDKLELAVRQHVYTNPHHPEYWGGLENTPEIYVAEMVADWYARSMEFGTSLRQWIKDTAVEKYRIVPGSQHEQWIKNFVDLLLQDYFVK